MCFQITLAPVGAIDTRPDEIQYMVMDDLKHVCMNHAAGSESAALQMRYTQHFHFVGCFGAVPVDSAAVTNGGLSFVDSC